MDFEVGARVELGHSCSHPVIFIKMVEVGPERRGWVHVMSCFGGIVFRMSSAVSFWEVSSSMGRILGDPDGGENMYSEGLTDLKLIRTKESVLPALVSNLERLANEWRAVASCLWLAGWELLECRRISPVEQAGSFALPGYLYKAFFPTKNTGHSEWCWLYGPYLT